MKKYKSYNDLIYKSGLAELSGIRGFMIIKPYGLSIWENIKIILDKILKNTGHSNVYFPFLIPKSLFSKEKSHIKGFAKECAIITHYRMLIKNDKIIIDPKSKLEEELIVRPTSETLFWQYYGKCIKSYKDLPILLNQWSNVVRWEMKTKMFIRTSEFLWQEGHTAHYSKKEAINQSIKMLNIYSNFLENFLSIPVIKGIKTENEKFYGAEKTYCIESIMNDGKAIQLGTSHFLGQNFSKKFNVKFTNKIGKKEYVWGTSWGISTRLIGSLILLHSDNLGLIIPPKIAPIQVVIIPIWDNNNNEIINEFCIKLKKKLENIHIKVKYDYNNNVTPGWKFNEYELKGIPIRITIGNKEIKKNICEIYRRDTLKKNIYNNENFSHLINKLLEDIQCNLLKKAKLKLKNFITTVDDYEVFKNILYKKGGFLSAHWDGKKETEIKIKKETNASIRCIPINNKKETGKCIFTGKKSNERVLFAKSY